MATTATIKRIVCLANSRKEGDRCIAGKELLADGSPGGWVRPVSDRGDEAVNESERQYEDGDEPRVLDVVDVPLLELRHARRATNRKTGCWIRANVGSEFTKLGRMHYRILLNRLSRSGLMATTRITGGTIGCRLTPPSRWIVRYEVPYTR